VVRGWEGCLYSTTYNVMTSNRGAVISRPGFDVWDAETLQDSMIAEFGMGALCAS